MSLLGRRLLEIEVRKDGTPYWNSHQYQFWAWKLLIRAKPNLGKFSLFLGGPSLISENAIA
jgi:hypothetical protein